MPKFCTYCKQELDTTLFSKNANRKDGLQTYCKECTKKYKKIKVSPEKAMEYFNKSKNKNLSKYKEKAAKRTKKYRDSHIETIQKKDRDYKQKDRQENPEKYRTRDTEKRIKRKLRRSLFPLYKEEIKTIYKKAADIERLTGIPQHVDHIVPLQGKTVSGLHVPWNLQIISAKENLTKSNKWYENI